MTNKTTKRALLLSVLAMVLSVSMLMGTTYAWFTDSVSNGINKIVSGNLDVALYHVDYLNGDYSNPEKVEADTPLFLNADGAPILWEPGAGAAEDFIIKNEGSLALKYQFKISFTNATTTPEGKTLADILDVTMYQIGGDFTDPTYGGANTDSTIISEENGGLEDCIVEGYLLPGENIRFLTTINWNPSDNDNDFNVEGGLSIDLGVTLVATQYTYEKDATGDQYDKDAEFTYPILCLNDLKAAAENGGNYELVKDIVIGEETIPVKNDLKIWMKNYDIDGSANLSRIFEMQDGTSLTIYGQSGEVKMGKYGVVNIPAGNDATVVLNGGTYTGNSNNGAPVMPRGDGDISITFKDVTIIDSGATSYIYNESAYNGNNITLTVDGGEYTAGLGFVTRYGTIKNAKITATNSANGWPAVYSMADVTVENCIINAAKSAVSVAGGAVATVTGCDITVTHATEGLAFQVFSSGGTINVFNTTYYGTFAGTGYGVTGPMTNGGVAYIYIDGTQVYYKK